MEPDGMMIVGIVLVRNEDVFIERVLRNVVNFCDRVLVADHQSKDGTWSIVQRLAGEFEKIECRRIRHPRESHDMIQGYAKADAWVFGVDGDEIYDPGGLKRFRKELLAGRWAQWWQIVGNVLNCERIDHDGKWAWGYLAPPARSMTKLYNFSAISAWEGGHERLHGGKLTFRPGYEQSRRYNLHEQVSWELSPFRCLHTCFLRRSSRDPEGGRERKNISDMLAEGMWGKLGMRSLSRLVWGDRTSWKRQAYMRGELVKVDVGTFFGQGADSGE